MPAKGQKLSEEAKRKISEAAKKRKGKANPFHGRKHTEESKAKMAEARRKCRGWKHTEETKAKMSAAAKGRPKPEEQKRKQSETMKRLYAEGKLTSNLPVMYGPDNPNYGRKLTDEQKKRIGDANRGRPWTEANLEAASLRTANRIVVDRDRVMTARAPVVTSKGGDVSVRGDLELRALELLEQDPNVVRIEYEVLTVPYMINGKNRWTVPDFRVLLADGSHKVIEVKAWRKSTWVREQPKIDAVRSFCEKRGWAFEVWGESCLWGASCPRDRWVCSLPTRSASPATKSS